MDGVEVWVECHGVHVLGYIYNTERGMTFDSIEPMFGVQELLEKAEAVMLQAGQRADMLTRYLSRK
jgi:hypothetical protein